MSLTSAWSRPCGFTLGQNAPFTSSPEKVHLQHILEDTGMQKLDQKSKQS